jgi:hypothetical protein
MEPRKEQQSALQPVAEQKPRRFRIVKMEERIAPAPHKTAYFCWYTRECTGFACSGGPKCW